MIIGFAQINGLKAAYLFASMYFNALESSVFVIYISIHIEMLCGNRMKCEEGFI
jgi:hypothetical protein